MSAKASAWSSPVCLLLPGWCVGRAVYQTGQATGAAARAEGRELASRAAEAAGAAGGSGASIFSGFGDGVADVLRAGASPVAETASATRFIAVAISIAVVGAVILALVLAWKF